VAEPGDIVFAEATRQQLPPKSEYEPLGEVSLRGLGRSVIAFRLRPSIETWALAL
jgi:class 3 adenylate cyclase